MIELKLQHSHDKKLTEKFTQQVNKSPQHQFSSEILSSLSQSGESNDEQVQIKSTLDNQFISYSSRPKKKKLQQKPVVNVSEILFQHLLQSQIKLPENIKQLISGGVRLAEDKIYISYAGDNATYLHRYRQQIRREDLQSGIQSIFHQVKTEILSDIWNGQYEIQFQSDKRKRKSQKIHNLNDDLKSKLTSLRTSMDLKMDESLTEQEQQKREKIKKQKASSFIRRVARQKQEYLKKKNERIQQYQAKIQKNQLQKVQFKERLKQQKHLRIKKRHQEARQARSLQIAEGQKKRKDYQVFLSQYKQKVPLFRQIQKRFYNSIMLNQKKREDNALNQIKQQRRPLNIEQLQNHENWYVKMRSQNEQKRKFEMAEQIRRRRAQSVQYYKGKAHLVVEEEFHALPQDPQAKKLQLRKKQAQYVKEIINNFKPKVNEEKRKQLEELEQKRKWSQRLKQRAKDANRMQDGNNNLMKLREFNNQMRTKRRVSKGILEGRVSKAITEKTSRTIDSKPLYKNYLQEIRQERLLQSDRYTSTIDYSSLMRHSDQAEIHLSKLEQKAMRKEKYLRNASLLCAEEFLVEKSRLNQNYLESAKAKLAMLNQIK